MAEAKSGGFLLHTAVVGIAVWVATQVVSGVSATGPIPLLIMALVLGLVNAVVKPILVVLTLPLTIVTLGLFYFVVNGLAFGLAAALVPGFDVVDIWAAILAGTVVSLVSWLIGLVTGRKSGTTTTGKKRVSVATPSSANPANRPASVARRTATIESRTSRIARLSCRP